MTKEELELPPLGARVLVCPHCGGPAHTSFSAAAMIVLLGSLRFEPMGCSLGPWGQICGVHKLGKIEDVSATWEGPRGQQILAAWRESCNPPAKDGSLLLPLYPVLQIPGLPLADGSIYLEPYNLTYAKVWQAPDGEHLHLKTSLYVDLANPIVRDHLLRTLRDQLRVEVEGDDFHLDGVFFEAWPEETETGTIWYWVVSDAPGTQRVPANFDAKGKTPGSNDWKMLLLAHVARQALSTEKPHG